MPVLIPTTTMTILREPANTPAEDRGDPTNYTTIASNVRCTVSNPSGISGHGPERLYTQYTGRVIADVCDLKENDRIIIDNVTYEVLAAVTRPTALIPSTVADIRRV